MKLRLQNVWDHIGLWLITRLWPRVFTDIEAAGFEEGEEWALRPRPLPPGSTYIGEVINLAEPKKGSQWGIGSGHA